MANQDLKDIVKKMPEDLRSEGIQFREQLSKLYWDIGDWVNKIYTWSMAEGISTNKKLVCAACAVLLDSDLHADSLYEYARVASFYGGDKIRERAGVLPFNHLRYAMRFGKDYEKVLEHDLDKMDEHNGTPVSLSIVKERFEPHLTAMYQNVVASPQLDFTVGEKEKAAEQITQKLNELEAMLETASVIDAEGAVMIARIVTLLRKAVKKIISIKLEKE